MKMLAVTVSKTCEGELAAAPFFKPLGQYLDFTSNHTPHVLRSWPRSMMMNIPKLCLNTDPNDAVQRLLDRFEGCFFPSPFLMYLRNLPLGKASIQVRDAADACWL